MGSPPKPLSEKQIKFRSGFLEHGDLERAFRDAGYKGSLKSAYTLLRQPWMHDSQDTMAALVDRHLEDRARSVRAAVLDKAAALESTEVRRLQTREGRRKWLEDVMEGRAMIEVTENYFDNEGNRMSEKVKRAADHRDRLKAAELLGKTYGDYVIQIDTNVTTSTGPKAVYVHVDNSRGPALPTTGVVSGTAVIEVCERCDTPHDAGAAHVCKPLGV